jgi:hypothetical protein
MASGHPIPKNREALRDGDWFPYVISKIAPLEWWSFSTSTNEIRPADFPSDWSYNLAKQDTWEFPRFCFAMFRPTLEADMALYSAVGSYQGDVIWQMHDGCINAFPARPRFVSAIDGSVFRSTLEEIARNSPHADPEFVKRALADIPKLCAYLETHLGLKTKAPMNFDPQWLTREGLASSRGQFEDFLEPGSWSVMLARDPEKVAKTGQMSSADDRNLNFGIGMFQGDALFSELGADWKRQELEGKSDPILPEYPLLSRLNDITADAAYQPNEVERLLAELTRAQAVVKDPLAIRGLDNLIRITRWAEKLKLGIYFGGQ